MKLKPLFLFTSIFLSLAFWGIVRRKLKQSDVSGGVPAITVSAATSQPTPSRPPDPQAVPSSLANARQVLSRAASWQPMPIGRIVPASSSIESISVEPNRVSFGGQNQTGQRIYGWLDLANGDVTRFATTVPRRTGSAGDYRWVYLMNDKVHTLELTGGNGVRRSYSIRGLYPPQQRGELPVRVLPEENRVLMFSDDHLLEWNLATGRLLRNSPRHGTTLARDGQTFVGIGENYGSFQIGDVATGKISKTIPWRTDGPLEYEHFSHYGRYCLFDTRDGTFRVVEVATGKVLWKFLGNFVFDFDSLMADDEKTIIVHAGKLWQVRDFRTGAILRRLTYLPDLNAAALAPDGATLYSVVKGMLYRQRTR